MPTRYSPPDDERVWMTTQRLRVETRILVAQSKTRLLQDVLDRLHRGILVPAPAKVWAGPGTGHERCLTSATFLSSPLMLCALPLLHQPAHNN